MHPSQITKKYVNNLEKTHAFEKYINKQLSVTYSIKIHTVKYARILGITILIVQEAAPANQVLNKHYTVLKWLEENDL